MFKTKSNMICYVCTKKKYKFFLKKSTYLHNINRTQYVSETSIVCGIFYHFKYGFMIRLGTEIKVIILHFKNNNLHILKL